MSDASESGASFDPRPPDAEAGIPPAVHAELRALARRLLRGESRRRVDPTSLLHEAYVQLHAAMPFDPAEPSSRARFFALAATTIRHVLVDQSRRERAEKRGGGVRPITLTDVADSGGDALDVDLEALDTALDALALLSPRQSRVVEMRFFGGLSVEDVAQQLGVSDRTIKTDWSMARAWLKRELARMGAP